MLQLSAEDMSANRRLLLKIGSVLISMVLRNSLPILGMGDLTFNIEEAVKNQNRTTARKEGSLEGTLERNLLS